MEPMDDTIDTRLDTERTRAFLTQELSTANDRLASEIQRGRDLAKRLDHIESLLEFAERTQDQGDLAVLAVRDIRRVLA